MSREELLLQRLEEIGRALEETGCALALIGLGSVGRERERLDEYSDLDFFVIARDGCKQALIENTAWLSAARPVAYAFRNTADGYKALFDDEVYCEYAVFERRELEAVPFAEGQIVWQAPGFDAAEARPRLALPAAEPRTEEWLLGEALTCVYVGLGRYRRGEKLSACRFVQGYAVDRLVELAPALEPESPARRDPFTPERRFEQRFPHTAAALGSFVQGYERTVESAVAILEFLDRRLAVNPALKAAILRLAAEPSGGS